jgi:hypothetical protein
MGRAVPDKETAKVPEVEMLAGVTDKNAGTVIPTEVTVPPPPAVAAMVIVPLPFVILIPEP